MKKLLALLLTFSFLFIGCSDLKKGEDAYKKGNYREAIRYFETVLKKDPLAKDAKKYLIRAQAGIYTDKAAIAIDNNKLEKAIKYLDEALGLDAENLDAKTLFSKTIGGLSTTIKSSYMPNKEWKKIIPLCNIILKYNKSNKEINSIKAKAIYNLNGKKLNAETIFEIKKAFAISPKDKFLLKTMTTIEKNGIKFEKIFKKYQKSLVKKEYDDWLRLVHPRFLKEIKADVKIFIEKKDERISSELDYFEELALDPEKYGSPDGAEILFIEAISKNNAFVHFTYKKQIKILKAEIVKVGNKFKVHKEVDSEIKKETL